MGAQWCGRAVIPAGGRDGNGVVSAMRRRLCEVAAGAAQAVKRDRNANGYEMQFVVNATVSVNTLRCVLIEGRGGHACLWPRKRPCSGITQVQV